MTFDFGKRAIKVCKCDGKVTFTIHFQDIYPFIKGDLAQHQERSCKGDLSITFTNLNGSLSKSLRSLKVYFRAVVYKGHPCAFTMLITFDDYVVGSLIAS